MLNQPYGLRFDIYERVHLSEGVPAIEELEEIELYPRIQVIGQDDHATLRGHLLLTGTYRGESEDSEELKHFIPVEITVPLNRVRSIDDISIEIENFDVDLLSSRSLNITGVLSLRGIEGFPAEEPQVWSADEFTVVHSPETQSDSRESELGQTKQFEISEQAELHNEEQELADTAELVAYGSPESADLSPRSEQQSGYEELSQAYWNQSSTEPLTSDVASTDEWNENRLPDSDADIVPSQASHEMHEVPSPISSFMAETADRLASYPEAEPLLPIEDENSAWSEPSVNHVSENSGPWNSEASEQTRSEAAWKPLEETTPEVWHFEEARSGGSKGEQFISNASAQPQTENWQEVFAVSETDQPEEDRPSLEVAEEASLLQNEEFLPEAIAEAEDKPELKVAFGSKKESSRREEEGVGISSLLSSGRAVRGVEGERSEEVSDGVVSEEDRQAEDVEWKNLFLGTIVDQTPFRKVKLCIVQREETLDAIADRYQLSTRELQLYNRLTEQVVEEGQILYIP
ncbi:LysM peptidoglycan-binding domain-containing protein [Paenibacillus polysaccharolyticus]|uniref:LysM peptidoglycan-binding domain-containing protein n=1 Tax=Paenibacillus polysaccharolyticus TaxID=582692 RepID=UPI002040B321|nr:LysM peptidoglycan-binding domain-containing protein [Paenibacillus polysaccharolyticus]MCM3134528.1 LysM peptidoglycan-binding domain-containing protein [Paenibacillus polysaccharolyticus]